MGTVRKEVGVKPIEQIMMEMKYWYHLGRSTGSSWLRAAFDENFKPYEQGRLVLRKKIHDIQKDVGAINLIKAASKNIFKGVVKKHPKLTSIS